MPWYHPMRFNPALELTANSGGVHSRRGMGGRSPARVFDLDRHDVLPEVTQLGLTH